LLDVAENMVSRGGNPNVHIYGGDKIPLGYVLPARIRMRD